jgi:hypothetical protein
MSKKLAAALALLLLTAAGLFWWQGRASEATVALAPAPAAAATPEGLPVGDPNATGKAPPMPAEAPQMNREQRRFARYDRDRDGIITRIELMASRARDFRKLDTDGNNLLSFEEWAVKTSDKFAGADADRNGRLTPAEFATTAPKRSAKPKCSC